MSERSNRQSSVVPQTRPATRSESVPSELSVAGKLPLKAKTQVKIKGNGKARGRKSPRVFRRGAEGEAEDSKMAGSGQLSLCNGALILEFRYSPERVEEVKKIPRARFEKTGKRWKLPLSAFEQLRQSANFNPEKISYSVSPEIIAALEGGEVVNEVEAEARLMANPFSVSEADIQTLSLDVVIRLNLTNRGLRVVPRFRSKAQAVVERSVGAHYVKSDKGYAIATQGLSELLIKLRDKGLRFAVESSAAEILKNSAELRAEILKNGYVPSAAELEEALLFPFLAENAEGDGYQLRVASSEQQRLLIPEASSFRERRAKAGALSESELLLLVERACFQNIRLFRSAEVDAYLARFKRTVAEMFTTEGFPDELLMVEQPPLCWAVSSSGTPGLLALSSLVPQIRNLIKNEVEDDLRGEVDNRAPNYRFVPFAQSGLSVAVEAVEKVAVGEQLGIIPRTERFVGIFSRAGRQSQVRLQTVRYKSLADIQIAATAFSEPNFGSRLFPHQRVAVQWLSEMSRAFLADDMGLGKTLSVLTTFDLLVAKQEVNTLLVICPNSLVRNWLRECKQWFPRLRTAIIDGDRAQKLKTLKRLRWAGETAGVVIINYEAARLDYIAEELSALLAGRQTLLCLDESQRIKNPASKTFAALLSVAELCPRRVLLSGTPTPKDLTDIWAQMRVLDDGERFGENYYQWLETVAELGNRYSEYAVRKFRSGAVKDTVARVEEVMLRRKKEDVIDLPEKTFLTLDVELTGEQKKRYDEIRKELLLRVTSLNGKSFTREITNVLEEYLRAVQIASNPRLVDETWKGEPAKFKELDLLVHEVVGERGEKLVIWTNYLANVRELVERYSKYEALPFSGEVSAAKRAETVASFQNQKSPQILVAVPAAGGVGITLTAAQTAIYLEKTWNAEHWLQSVDRIHRIGQRGTVRIISLHGCGVDELISKNIARKAREQAKLLGDAPAALKENTPSVVDLLPSRDELLAALSSISERKEI